MNWHTRTRKRGDALHRSIAFPPVADRLFFSSSSSLSFFRFFFHFFFLFFFFYLAAFVLAANLEDSLDLTMFETYRWWNDGNPLIQICQETSSFCAIIILFLFFSFFLRRFLLLPFAQADLIGGSLFNRAVIKISFK